jgi:hypothetical protein
MEFSFQMRWSRDLSMATKNARDWGKGRRQNVRGDSGMRSALLEYIIAEEMMS